MMKNRIMKRIAAFALAFSLAAGTTPARQALAAVASASLALGDAVTFTGAKDFTSSDDDVVTVTKDGRVDAVGPGTAVVGMIYAGFPSSYKFKVTLTGRPAYDKKLKTLAKKLAKGCGSDAEKVKAVHDYLVKNTAYDYSNYKAGTIPEDDYTAAGLLKNKTAVCEGYAKAFLASMKVLGIPCKMVSGKVDGENHAWNLVKIGKKWYHIDVTWDDPVPDRKGQIGYDYFLLSDKEMAADHVWTRSGYPKCNTGSEKYISLYAAVCDDGGQLEGQVAKALKSLESGDSFELALKSGSGLTTQDVFNELYRQGATSIAYGRPVKKGNYTLITIYP